MSGRWRARLLIIAMIAGTIYGSVHLYRVRHDDAAQFALDQVALTAQSIPVESLRTGRVTKVRVAPEMRVTKGQSLGTLTVATTTAEGESRTTRVKLKAPVDGVVVDEPLAVGQTLQPGQTFVTLYDPSELSLVTDVPVSEVHLLSPGMTAELTTPGDSTTIHATVDRFVPRVSGSTGGADSRHLEAVLVPSDPDELASLTPGLSFTGSVDTDSVSADAPVSTTGLE